MRATVIFNRFSLSERSEGSFERTSSVLPVRDERRSWGISRLGGGFERVVAVGEVEDRLSGNIILRYTESPDDCWDSESLLRASVSELPGGGLRGSAGRSFGTKVDGVR